MVKFRLVIFKTLFWFLIYVIVSILLALVAAFFWWLVANGFVKEVPYAFCWKWSFLVLLGLSALERIIIIIRIIFLTAVFHLKYKVPRKGLDLAILEYSKRKEYKKSKENFIQWLKTNNWNYQFNYNWKKIVFDPFY